MKPLLILSFGNILEWYDFSLYIYFADLISATFFPVGDPFASKLLALGTFFIGGMARPLGGLCMGWLGDRYQQARSIHICVITMGVSTCLIAFLPDYAHIGILAPLSLILLRIIQGLSVGGQFPGLITLSTQEHTTRRGFAIGLVYALSTLGFLLGSGVGWGASKLTLFIPPDYLWRLPFALSGILFMLYLFLNRKRPQAISENSIKKNALRTIIRQWRAILAVIALTTMAASLYYLVFTYLVLFRIQHLQIDASRAFLNNIVILTLAIILYPCFGALADRVGYARLFYVSAALLGILLYPFLLHIQLHPNFGLFPLVGLTLLLTAIQGAISPYFATGFDEAWRGTACALAYSIGNGLSGGAPLVAEILSHHKPWGLILFSYGLLFIGGCGMFYFTRYHLSFSKSLGA